MLKADANTLINAIEASGKKLNDWERLFVLNMKSRSRVTEKQGEKLGDIYRRVYGG